MSYAIVQSHWCGIAVTKLASTQQLKSLHVLAIICHRMNLST
jgi:hypothetical protein